MTHGEMVVNVLIPILSVIALIVVVMFLMSGGNSSSDEHEELKEDDFTPLNGEYANFADFKIVSDALREEFKRQKKSDFQFRGLDYFEDQFWIRLKVREHYHALKRNTEKRVKKNDYGAVVQDTRADEIIEFLQSTNFPQKVMDSETAISTALDAIHEFSLQMELSGFDASTIPTNGFEFEGWVATNLKKFGWDAEATQGSGDQGLDVIAKKDGCRVGIQCKLYSSNVGNKAVQEINAAKAHFNLDKVAVLTNAGYTKSARELAQTCDVLLLSHYDIPRFDELFLGESA